MKLRGAQVEQIIDAFLSAFRSEQDLEIMVRLKLDQNLAAIAKGENLRQTVFALVAWAEENGKLDELIFGAQQFVPGNPDLRELAIDYQRWKPTKAGESTTHLPTPEVQQGSDDRTQDRQPRISWDSRRAAMVAAGLIIVAGVVLVTIRIWPQLIPLQPAGESRINQTGTPGPTASTADTNEHAGPIPGSAASPTPNTALDTPEAGAAEPYLLEGQQALNDRAWDLAIEQCGQAAAIDPNSIEAHACLGFAYNQLDENQRAIHHYGEVIRLDPSNPTALLERGLLYNVEGDCAAAVVDLERYLDDPVLGYEDVVRSVLDTCEP